MLPRIARGSSALRLSNLAAVASLTVDAWYQSEGPGGAQRVIIDILVMPAPCPLIPPITDMMVRGGSDAMCQLRLECSAAKLYRN